MHKENVYIIIPVHNRKAITLKCLDTLKENADLDKYYVIVVDDGSTDGTSEAIQSLYPDVIVLIGDGNLWWTGGIKKGMEYAYTKGAEYLIWLNDDTFPCQDSIRLMLQECCLNPDMIGTGQCYADTDLSIPTYSGQKKYFFTLRLQYAELNEIIDCDCTSGNFVCIPRSVVDAIGFPPNHKFPHSLADVVYTWTAKQAGYRVKIIGNATAICKFNPMEQGWSSSPIPMSARWKIILSPKSNLYPPSHCGFCAIFYGYLAIIPFVFPYLSLIMFTILRFLLPLSILRNLKSIKDKIFVSYRVR